MRVIDCDECGETLRGADDGELMRRLIGHYRSEHDSELSREEAEEFVDGDAYEAADA